MNSDDTNTGAVRTVCYTDEFKEFYNELDEKVSKNIDYVILTIKNFKIIHTDFVKKLVNKNCMKCVLALGQMNIIRFYLLSTMKILLKLLK